MLTGASGISGEVETPAPMTSSFPLDVTGSVFCRGSEDCRTGREGQDSASDNEGGDKQRGRFPLDVCGLDGGVRRFLLWEPSSAGCCRAVCEHMAICSVSFSSGAKKLDSGMESSSLSSEPGVNRGRETRPDFLATVAQEGEGTADVPGTAALVEVEAPRCSASIRVRSRDCRCRTSSKRPSMERNSDLRQDSSGSARVSGDMLGGEKQRTDSTQL